MPYVITAQAPDRIVWEGERSTVVTRPPERRTAYAALNPETVRRVANSLFDGRVDGSDFYEIRNAIEASADGGSFTLADGTVVEVERVDWIELANRAILNDERRFDNAAILAAFNLSHSQAPAAA